VKRDLRFEAVYSNGLEEVWHALTDSGSLADWLMENDVKPLPGHKFHFLVLVQGDPTTDIHATRQIVAVWKKGVLVQRKNSE
jgi:uncharacterized protein YndB with AHSA1/START domain